MQSKLVDVSQDTAFTGRSTHGSYKSSTSSHRLSSGQYVLCCVFVPVVVLSAFFAVKFTNVQRHLFMNVSAIGTPLTTGKVSVTDLQFASVPRALISQHSAEHAETSARNMLCKISETDHAANIQILNSQHVKSTNQIGREFVQHVLSGVGNMSMKSRDFKPLSIPASASLLPSTKHALQSSQFLCVLSSMSWIRDPLTITERGQPIDSKINPDFLPCLQQRLLCRFIQHETNEVASSTVLGYRNGAGAAGEFSTPLHSEMTEFTNPQVLIICVPRERGFRKFSALASALALETGILSAFLEEFFKCGLKMPQYLLLRNTRAFEQPSELWVVPVFCPRGAALGVIDRFSIFIGVRAQSECIIIGVTRAPELFCELALLRLCRIESKRLPRFHTTSIHCVEKLSS